jgi:hypothetical protein
VEAASALAGVQTADLNGLLVRLSDAFDRRDAAMQTA